MSAVTNAQHTEVVNILCYKLLLSSLSVQIPSYIAGILSCKIEVWLKHARRDKT